MAIKVLQPAFAANPEQLKRFELEARAVALLDHPNIPLVYHRLTYRRGVVEGVYVTDPVN